MHHSTREHRIDREHALALRASDKVLDASISSTSFDRLLMYEGEGSRKIRFSGGYNVPLAANPFNDWATVLDCGDIPVTSYGT